MSKKKKVLVGLAGVVLVSALLVGSLEKPEQKDEQFNVPVAELPKKEETPLDRTIVIRKLKFDVTRTLLLSGEVSDNAELVASGIAQLDEKSNEPITILIDGPGGSVIHGARLIAQMEITKSPIYTVCIKLCASMSAMVHQMGTKRLALNKAILMFHPASVSYGGDVDRISSFITTIKKYTDRMEVKVASKMGLSLDQYKARIGQELWIESQDAVGEKILDGIVTLGELDPGSLSLLTSSENKKNKSSESIRRTDRINTLTW